MVNSVRAWVPPPLTHTSQHLAGRRQFDSTIQRKGSKMDAAETVLSLTLTVAVPMKSKKAKRKENRDPDSKAA